VLQGNPLAASGDQILQLLQLPVREAWLESAVPSDELQQLSRVHLW
jgi:hypothetical protein